MTPALVRLKCAVIDAVASGGGKDGAAATAGRCPSVAGDWRNENHRAFPPLDCAFLIDRAAVVAGRRPEMLFHYAAELGFVTIQLPGERDGSDAVTSALIDASAEFGDVATEVRDATRDGTIVPKERVRIVSAIDEAIASLVRMRSVVDTLPEDARLRVAS